MNIFTSPKTLVRLWAALYSDFESLMARFMSSKGWRYIHFARICKEMQITLVMHATQGRGKTRDEHYDVVTHMIFQICKELWLRAGDVVRGRSKTVADNKMELKRGLGGFYLLYTLFEKQPYRDRTKIALGVDDLKSFYEFTKAISVLGCQNEVVFMIEYLVYKESFHYCVFAEDFRFEAMTRALFNSGRSEVVDLTRRMRDGQDILAYSSVHTECSENLASMGLAKNGIANDLLKTVQPRALYNHLTNNNSKFDLFVRTLPTESVTDALKTLSGIVDKPVLNLQSLTATEAIDGRLLVETQRRMERARKKIVRALDRDGPHNRAAKPYVQEGSIFGRKKEIDEGEGKGHRRERGACNGNLWVFINGYDFDKPMGEPGQNLPPPMSDMSEFPFDI